MNSPHSAGSRPTRRDLIRLAGGGLLATVSLSSCSFFSTDPSASTGNNNDKKSNGANPKEAPMLTEQVKSSKLPKLADRMPKTPMVLTPDDGIGKYSGTWKSVMLNATDTPWLGRTVGYEPFQRFDPNGTKLVPNVAESIESSDMQTYTIKLREGMKWSDGKPFTADDVVFAFDDWSGNAELSPVFPDWLASDGEPATMKKVDETTVTLTYPKVNALFGLYGNRLIASPKHYMQQFHKKYNPDAPKLAKDAKFATWNEYFSNRADAWGNPDLPVLNAWVVKEPLGEGNRVTFERNPYYWKTDPEGSQLPYFDKIIFDVIAEKQVILLKATSGELDMSTRHINTLQDKPVLGESRAEGKYDFITLDNTVMNDLILPLNLNHKDPQKRRLFQIKDFRIALSHAINREEMIQAVWQRQGVVWQAAPDDRSEYYDEEFAKQYTEYNVDLANEMLDSVGLTRKDRDGYRIYDGKRLTINIEVANPAFLPLWPEGANRVAQDWKKVGIFAAVKSEDRSLFYERKDPGANEHDVAVWMGDGGHLVEIFEPRWYFPYSNESNYAELWQLYFNTRGKDGEKPPAQTLKQMELYWELIKTADEAARKQTFKEIIQIAKEQFYAIGTVRTPDSYGIVKNDFKNVPKKIPESHVFNTPGLGNPPLWYRA